jgi:hypothetical protein
MLFPRNALASGPQACLGAEKGLSKMKVGFPNEWTSAFSLNGVKYVYR